MRDSIAMPKTIICHLFFLLLKLYAMEDKPNVVLKSVLISEIIFSIILSTPKIYFLNFLFLLHDVSAST